MPHAVDGVDGAVPGSTNQHGMSSLMHTFHMRTVSVLECLGMQIVVSLMPTIRPQHENSNGVQDIDNVNEQPKVSAASLPSKL